LYISILVFLLTSSEFHVMFSPSQYRKVWRQFVSCRKLGKLWRCNRLVYGW